MRVTAGWFVSALRRAERAKLHANATFLGFTVVILIAVAVPYFNLHTGVSSNHAVRRGQSFEEINGARLVSAMD